MQHALTLARESIGVASPNPQVSCVLVKNNQIIGEGAHRYDAYDHAEIVALKQAGESSRGATAYVTLEPCSHYGRTGPCADALIAAGIARAFIATEDPNSQVSGKGIAKLRASGIEVTLGLCQDEARAINDPFAKFIRTRTPLVTLKSALSRDGKIAPASHTQQPHWLTGPEARAEVHRLRHAQDALLTGIGTVLADDPLLTDRSGLTRRRPLLRVVLDAQLRTALNSRIVQTAQDDVLLFCSSSAPEKNRAALLAKNIRIEAAAESTPGQLDLAAVLHRMGELEILSVLIEAGSHLNSSFLSANLVDKVVLFNAPTELGEDAIPFAASGPTPDALENILQRTSHRQFAEDVCITGYLHDPWA